MVHNVFVIQVEPTAKSNVLVVRLTGRLDAAASGEFEDACGRAFAAGAQNLVLDVSELRYVSSAGLRVILSAAKTLQSRGGTLRLAGLGGMVREVFEISGFSSLFPQYESVEAAVMGAA